MMDDWSAARFNCTAFSTNGWSANRVGRVRPLICPDPRATLIEMLLPVARALGGCRCFGFSCKAVA